MNRKSSSSISRVEPAGALCCCEYIDEHNERAHILATSLCNCEAVDEAFERLFTTQSVPRQNMDRILHTLSDRFRIPWVGGARKVPLDIALAVLLVTVTIFLGSLSWVMGVVTYTFILPSSLLVIHYSVRKAVVGANVGLSKRENVGNKSKFYFAFLATSVLMLLVVYYTQVLAELKITALENFAFLVLLCVSATCLYLVRVTAWRGFEYKVKGDSEDEVFESGAWRNCVECDLKVPREASHCYVCGTCFLLRDHHCVWLDTCISQVNDRLFMVGLVSGFLGLCYGCQLTFTTVCHPRLLNLHFTHLLIPHTCTDAYMNSRYSWATSAGFYGLFLSVFVCFALVQQVVCVLYGVRVREFRPKSRRVCVLKPLENCIKFWCR